MEVAVKDYLFFRRYFEWKLKVEEVQVVIHISVTLSISVYLETLEVTLI